MVNCMRCGREIESKVKAKGNLGKLHDIFEKAGMPAICCECEPSSGWIPVQKKTQIFDGVLFCGECKMPILSDGKGSYRHIIDLPRKRLPQILHDPLVRSQVFDWLCSIEVECPCCGPRPNPFKDIAREEAVKYLGTSIGSKDLFLVLRDLFHQPLGHPSELNAEDALAEVDKILREKNQD